MGGRIGESLGILGPASRMCTATDRQNPVSDKVTAEDWHLRLPPNCHKQVLLTLRHSYTKVLVLTHTHACTHVRTPRWGAGRERQRECPIFKYERIYKNPAQDVTCSAKVLQRGRFWALENSGVDYSFQQSAHVTSMVHLSPPSFIFLTCRVKIKIVQNCLLCHGSWYADVGDNLNIHPQGTVELIRAQL